MLPLSDMVGNSAEFAQDILRDGSRETGRFEAFDLAMYHIVIEIEEVQALQCILAGLVEELAQGGPGDRAPAETGNDRMDLHIQTFQCHANVRRHNATDTDGKRLFDDQYAFGFLQGRFQRLFRERSNEQMLTDPIATPSARISSTTSLMVPFTDPRATTRVSAPSV